MWIARDKEGYLVGFNHKPIRTNYDECGFYGWTIDNKCIPINDVVNMQVQLSHIMLPRELFPELTWENEPIEVELFSFKDIVKKLQGPVNGQGIWTEMLTNHINYMLSQDHVTDEQSLEWKANYLKEHWNVDSKR